MFGQILVKYTDLELSEMTVEDFKKKINKTGPTNGYGFAEFTERSICFLNF